MAGASDVEEPREFEDDAAKVRFGEIVALGVAVDIAETIVIAGFELEMADTGNGIFKADAGGDAIVEFMLDGHRVLRTNGIDAVGHIAFVPLEIRLRAFAEVEPKLRTCLEEKLRPTLFATPSEMGENRHLNVVDGAAVFLGKPCHLIDDGLVVVVENLLLPTHLRVVHLGLHGTNRIEIFFADIKPMWVSA